MTTPLQLNGYGVTHLLVHERDAFDGRDELLFELAVDPTHLVNDDDPELHQLILRVKVAEAKADPNGAPYDIEVEGRAIFRVGAEAEIDDQAKQKLVIFNGSAILLGMLRGLVSQVTAISLHGTFLLPPVNLVEAFAEKYGANSAPEKAEDEAETESAGLLAAEAQSEYE